MIAFHKYQALGNDYLVIEESDLATPLTAAVIARICDRHYGIGGDGILQSSQRVSGASFGLRIFNPDGSEAEKSGNGLRIFARYLWDRGLAGVEEFTVSTRGGRVSCRVRDAGRAVTVEMGRVRFASTEIPVRGPEREVLREEITVDGQVLEYSAATIGNPHCVVSGARVCAAEACRLGPKLEVEPRFPNRTNVQLLEVMDRENIRIEIWERGAGYTLASGSSSCAAGAVARRLGRCGPTINVHMPGGVLAIAVSPDYDVVMTGPVTKVGEGTLADEGLDCRPDPAG